jgi:hypothetical protein
LQIRRNGEGLCKPPRVGTVRQVALRPLETEPEGELNQAWLISLRIDNTEIWLIGLTASSGRRPELGFVEQVEDFRPEL